MAVQCTAVHQAVQCGTLHSFAVCSAPHSSALQAALHNLVFLRWGLGLLYANLLGSVSRAAKQVATYWRHQLLTSTPTRLLFFHTTATIR